MPKVTFLPENLTAEVAPGTSILDAAEACGARVGHACGGNCACSTCHVYVRKGYNSLSDIDEDEDDILDKAFDVQPVSRLSCQARVGNEDLVCEVSKESHKAWLDENPAEREREKREHTG